MAVRPNAPLQASQPIRKRSRPLTESRRYCEERPRQGEGTREGGKINEPISILAIHASLLPFSEPLGSHLPRPRQASISHTMPLFAFFGNDVVQNDPGDNA
ncbi:uncharacterized protein PG998_008877 [Apiospora kogelbergensis]|uniref:uncharacterized protein n=1 Tax=Apiospora kogelbergensis TaxID=1337665 RepID=UPI00312ECF1F